MKLTVTHGFYSHEKGRIIEKGEVIELEEERAKELISLKLALEIKEKPVKAPAKKPEPKQEKK